MDFIVPCEGHMPDASGVHVFELPPTASRLRRMVFTPWLVLWRALRSRAIVYHFHDAELIPIGWLLKLCGKKVIYDAHEDLSADLLNKTYIPPKFRRFVSRCAYVIERLSAKVFDRVVAATPAIARNFPPSRTVTIQNFPILGELDHVAAEIYESRPAQIAYVGMLTLDRGALEMARAMASAAMPPDAKLIVAGDFENEELAETMRREAGWMRVDYRGHAPRAAVAEVLASARAGLLLYHPVPNLDESQPNKLFEYMSVGLPVIASSFAAYRRFIDQERCGLTVNPCDPDAIAQAIIWILQHPADARAMGERGRQAIECRYNWDIESRKLIGLYRELTG